MSTEYDCVVIGAGPAGGTAAALVAEKGNRTLLVEREKMPRFHVGESLMPEVFWTLKRLGVLERVKAKGQFTPKNGVQFVTHMGKETRPFFFQEHDERECSLTWHVKREDFDQILFENAAEKGAECRDQTRVMQILFADDGPHRVELQNADGSIETVTAKVVIDASGQQSLISNKLSMKDFDPELKKAAIWGYFKNARRNGTDGEAEVTCILNTKEKKAWYWYIPLADGTVSVGLVADNDYLLKGRGQPKDTFFEEMDNCEGIRNRLADAELMGDLRVAKEFSYKSRKHAGNGWVLVGDAYSFIDPVYSSGVFLALKSGEMAADAVNEGLEKGDLSEEQLSKWSEEYDEGMKLFRKLVNVFYTDEFSFAEFMKRYPQHKGNLTDLLIGRVYGDNQPGRIFEDLDPWLEHSRQGTLDEYLQELPPSEVSSSM